PPAGPGRSRRSFGQIADLAGLVHRRHHRGAVQRLEGAAQPGTGLDLQYAVADGADDLGGAAHAQPVAHGPLAVEAAADIGVLDLGDALVAAAVGDLDDPAVAQGRLDAALDDQMLAGGDVAAGQRDLAPDHQLAIGFAGCVGGRRLGGARPAAGDVDD